MSWWRYEKSTGRGRWLNSSEVSIWLFVLLSVFALIALTIAVNLAIFLAVE